MRTAPMQDICTDDGDETSSNADMLSFVIDPGSVLEYHLQVFLPPARSGLHDNILRENELGHGLPHHQLKFGNILQELERVYVTEGLPEWQLDSFLAVAAMLADDGEDAEWDETRAQHAEVGDTDCRTTTYASAVGFGGALEKLRALPGAQVQQLIHEFAEGYAKTQVGNDADSTLRTSCFVQSHGNAVADEELVLMQYSVLMRDSRKAGAIIELMDRFWREGLALAEQRKADVREAEAQRDKVSVEAPENASASAVVWLCDVSANDSLMQCRSTRAFCSAEPSRMMQKYIAGNTV